MDVLLWVGWLLAIIVTVFTIWMTSAGVVVARSPSWEAAMYAAGVSELTARGFLKPRVSIQESRLIAEVLGPAPTVADADLDVRLVAAIRALTDATDSDLDGLFETREALVRNATSQLHTAVVRIATPWLFVRIWKLHRSMCSLRVVVAGLRWFVPLFVARTRRIGGSYLTTATLIGVWLGLLYWGFSQWNNESASSDWLTIVSFIVTFACVIGLVAAVIRQLSTVAVAWWGPPSRWTPKEVLYAVGVTIAIGGLLFLTLTGTLQRASIITTTWLSAEIERLDAAEAVGAVVVLVMLAYLVYRSVALVRARHIKTTDRVAQGIAAIFWVSLAAAVVAFAVDASEPWRSVTTYTVVATVAGAVVYFGVISVVEWVRDYRRLRSVGISVPRRGFRLWALCAWIIASLLVAIAASLVPMLAVGWSTTLMGQVTNLFLLAVQLVLLLSFLPGLIVTVLYLRRVSKYASIAAYRD